MKAELVVHSDPKSPVSETLKIIRTNIQFLSVDEHVKTILVTSSVHGEGKSFISANLAATLAQNGSKVLLVDCDLRKGRLHKIFDVESENGLSDLLIDSISTDVRKYMKKTHIANLSLITMGTLPPNPSELLSSARCKVIVEMLKNKFDYIIFDGTPTTGLTDSIVMASMVDKVVIVTSIGDTNVELLKNCKESLENVGASIAGVVVNRVPDIQMNY